MITLGIQMSGLRLISILVILILVKDSHPFLAVEKRIVGGYITDITENPWLVQLVMNNRQLCGASIVDQLTILTAGHCFGFSQEPSEYSIAYGLSIRFQDNGHDIRKRHSVPVAQIIRKTEDWPDGDIAILKLARPMELDGTNAAAIDMYQHKDFGRFLDEGLTCKVAGWGDRIFGSKRGSRELREVSVEISTKEACSTYLRGEGDVIFQLDYPRKKSFDVYASRDRVLCAGASADLENSPGGKDACQMDSGGPLVCKPAGGGDWVQMGIVSYGDKCGRPAHPGIYTHVGYFRDWMEDVRDTPGGTTCTDGHRSCASWKNSGYCTSWSYMSWMRSNCKRSCGMCSSGTDGRTPAKCENLDNDRRCRYRAFFNQCTTNSDYMEERCRKACSLCTDPDVVIR